MEKAGKHILYDKIWKKIKSRIESPNCSKERRNKSFTSSWGPGLKTKSTCIIFKFYHDLCKSVKNLFPDLEALFPLYLANVTIF